MGNWCDTLTRSLIWGSDTNVQQTSWNKQETNVINLIWVYSDISEEKHFWFLLDQMIVRVGLFLMIIWLNTADLKSELEGESGSLVFPF